MDHHQREQRRAAAEAFNQSLEQLAACFQIEDLTATDFLALAASGAEGENQQGENQQGESQVENRPEDRPKNWPTNQPKTQTVETRTAVNPRANVPTNSAPPLEDLPGQQTP